MFLVKVKIDGQAMVLPCQNVGPDPRNSALTRLDGVDVMINNFRTTNISVQPRDIEFIAEGDVMSPAPQAASLPTSNGVGHEELNGFVEPEASYPES